MRTIYTTPAGKGCYQTRSEAEATCPHCNRQLAYRPVQEIWVCPRRTRDPLWRMRKAAGGKVRFLPEALEWIGAKVGVAADDERLPGIAIQLAADGKLLALITPNGSLVAIAKAQRELR